MVSQLGLKNSSCWNSAVVSYWANTKRIILPLILRAQWRAWVQNRWLVALSNWKILAGGQVSSVPSTRIISDLQLPGWSLPGCSQLVQLVPLRFSQWTHVWLDYNWILDNPMNWTWRWNKSPLFSGSCDSVTPKWPLKSIESDCQLIRDTNIARGLSRAS